VNKFHGLSAVSFISVSRRLWSPFPYILRTQRIRTNPPSDAKGDPSRELSSYASYTSIDVFQNPCRRARRPDAPRIKTCVKSGLRSVSVRPLRTNLRGLRTGLMRIYRSYFFKSHQSVTVVGFQNTLFTGTAHLLLTINFSCD